MSTVQTDKTDRRRGDNRSDRRRDRTASGAPLDGHYRAIGISAVAAAMRYHPETSRAVYAPKLIREQD
ncbi:MAG TPA: hypothetical protein VNQ56_11130 [Pseudolabrys sp.]|nr:hypothetical protein [Pseudolabrys sp.]